MSLFLPAPLPLHPNPHHHTQCCPFYFYRPLNMAPFLGHSLLALHDTYNIPNVAPDSIICPSRLGLEICEIKILRENSTSA